MSIKCLVPVVVATLAVNVSGQALPAEWIDAPFGTYQSAHPGWSRYEAGTFTLAGSGSDLYGAANDGARFVFKPVHGDCDVYAVVAQPTSTDLARNARAGVMIREHNGRGSRHMIIAHMRGTIGTEPDRITASGRLTLDATGSALSRNNIASDPQPFRLIRQGDICRCYYNSNGVWTLLNTLTIAMGENLNAGVFVTSGNGGAGPVITNAFTQVAARPLVAVQNIATGLETSWVTDLPTLAAGWDYTYTLSRTGSDGTVTPLASGLTAAAFTDETAATGIWYRYTATAVPVPQGELIPPPDALLGTSAAIRIPYSTANLAASRPQGWYAAYYAPTGAIPPVLSRVESHLTNAAAATVAGTNINYRATLFASLLVDTADTYSFFSDSDDGVRLTVGDTEILNNWYGGRSLAQSGPVRLEAGRVYPVRLDYLQNTAGRTLTLHWRRAGAPEVTEEVPADVFAPVPHPWRHEDIGDTKLNGNALFDLATGAITILANGNALTHAADACHLVAQETTGDFVFTARLDSLGGTGAERRAGVVFRSDRTPGSAGVALFAVPGTEGYAVGLASRAAAGTAPLVVTTPTSVTPDAPLWLRLARVGMTVTAFYRADGDSTWTTAGTAALPNTLNGLAGLAVSSADETGSAQALFGAAALAALPAVALTPTHDVYLRGNNVNYGTAAELVLKRVAGSDAREIFMRFNVAGAENVRSAVLRLYVQGRSATPETQELVLRAFHDLAWEETGVTWTNAPGGLRIPTVFLADNDPTIVGRTTLPQTGEYVYFDISDAVRAAASGSGDLTLNLFSLTVVPGNPSSFGSKESAAAAHRPALLLSTDAPQNVTAEGGPDAGAITVGWHAYDGAEAYRVYRAPAAGGPFAPVGGDVTETRFKNTGLTVGQRYWYRVAAVTPQGETEASPAVWADASAGAVTLYASEDTYVNGGTDLSDSNYGSSTALTLKYNSGDQRYHREAYLLFNDIAGLGHVERAVLRVTPSTSSGGDYLPSQIPVQFVRMPSNAWSETTVTFNNPPPGYAPPTPRVSGLPESDRVTALAQPVNTVMEVDVTAMLREAARVNADQKLSIGILRTDNLGGFNLSLYSLNDGTANRRPQLVYTLGRTQPPEVSGAKGYVEAGWLPYRGATGYVLRRAEAPEGPYTILATTAETSFQDLTAEAGKTYYYTLAATRPGGAAESSRPAAVRIHVLEARYPEADAAIDENSKAAFSGANGTLPLKRAPAREAFFKFRIDDLASVSNARLRVNVSAQSAGYVPVNVIVRQGDFGDWNEYGITYNNPPPGHTPPSRSTSEPGADELARILYAYKDPSNGYDNWIEADVTEAVRQAAAGGKRHLTLFLTGDDTLQHSDGFMNVVARENGAALKRPVLLVSGCGFGTPHSLRAEAVAEGPGFTLHWRPVAGAVRYIVTRSAPPAYAPVTVAEDVTGTTFTDIDAAFWNDRGYTYTVRAVHADGTVSEAASVAQTLTRTFTRPVLADTYVRAGSSTNSSFALQPIMEVKADGDMTYQREAFLRVGADNLPDFLQARLRLRLRSQNTNLDYEVVVRETADTGWAESGGTAPTWNSVLGEGAPRSVSPPDGDPSVIARFNMLEAGYQPGDDLLFDITGPLKAAQARSAPSLMLHIFVTDMGGQNNFTLHAIQAALIDDMPQVLFTAARNPTPGTILWLK